MLYTKIKISLCDCIIKVTSENDLDAHRKNVNFTCVTMRKTILSFEELPFRRYLRRT